MLSSCDCCCSSAAPHIASRVSSLIKWRWWGGKTLLSINFILILTGFFFIYINSKSPCPLITASIFPYWLLSDRHPFTWSRASKLFSLGLQRVFVKYVLWDNYVAVKSNWFLLFYGCLCLYCWFFFFIQSKQAIDDSWNHRVVGCICCDVRTGQPPLISPPTFWSHHLHHHRLHCFQRPFANADHEVVEALMCGSINLVWQAGRMVHSSLSHFTAVIHHAARVLPAVMNDWWGLLIHCFNVPRVLIVGANFDMSLWNYYVVRAILQNTVQLYVFFFSTENLYFLAIETYLYLCVAVFGFDMRDLLRFLNQVNVLLSKILKRF